MFLAWFAGLRDLDAADYAAAFREAVQDQSIGSSPKDRIENPSRAKSVARVLTVIAFSSVVWAWLYTRPFVLVIIVNALFPWIAVGLCWKFGRLFTIEDPEKSSLRGDLISLLILPSLALALRALDVDLVTRLT